MTGTKVTITYIYVVLSLWYLNLMYYSPMTGI